MSHSTGLHKIPIIGNRVNRNPSCNEILPRLYLGDISVATNKEEMARMGITDMITIEIRPIQPSDLAPTVKRYLFINVMDHQKQDIMSHFETSNEFIETALKTPSNRVYIHCVAGISRSASLVIAYIMKTRSMSYTEAFESVRAKRKIIDPNEGFVRQLTLYHKLNYSIDIGNLDYRRMVLDALVFEFRLIALSYYQVHTSSTSSPSSSKSVGSNPGTTGTIQVPVHLNFACKDNIGILFDQYYNKLHLQQVSKHPQTYDPATAFKCSKCRAVVFYAISVIENKVEDIDVSATASGTTSSNLDSTGSNSSGHKLPFNLLNRKSNKPGDCPSIFIEPQPWMSKDILTADGDLNCYKCKRRLGKFDWTSKESCSCDRHNSHINFNLFKMARKKIDPGVPYRPRA